MPHQLSEKTTQFTKSKNGLWTHILNIRERFLGQYLDAPFLSKWAVTLSNSPTTSPQGLLSFQKGGAGVKIPGQDS